MERVPRYLTFKRISVDPDMDYSVQSPDGKSVSFCMVDTCIPPEGNPLNAQDIINALLSHTEDNYPNGGDDAFTRQALWLKERAKTLYPGYKVVIKFIEND